MQLPSQYEKPSDLEGWKYVNSPMGVRYEKDTHISFKDYNTLSDGLSIANQHLFGTAKESGLSLLKANGVLLENRHGKDKPNHIGYIGNPSKNDILLMENQIKIKQHRWQQAQEQVWLKPHIFIKR